MDYIKFDKIVLSFIDKLSIQKAQMVINEIPNYHFPINKIGLYEFINSDYNKNIKILFTIISKKKITIGSGVSISRIVEKNIFKFPVDFINNLSEYFGEFDYEFSKEHSSDQFIKLCFCFKRIINASQIFIAPQFDPNKYSILSISKNDAVNSKVMKNFFDHYDDDLRKVKILRIMNKV
jgi:hypothetical protein